MKRVISVAIILMMVLIILTGCGGGGDKKDTGASESKYVGIWTLTSVDVSGNGQEVSAEDMNISGSLNVESNGTIHIDLGDERERWREMWKEKDGKLVLEATGLVGEMKDGRVVLKAFGKTVYFSK